MKPPGSLDAPGRRFSDASDRQTSAVSGRNQFKKDLRIFSDLDGVCPHCGNGFVILGMTPESCLLAEVDAEIDALLAENLVRGAAARRLGF
jgi:hypothetical protein